jgi:hypothetical protein
MPLRKRLLKLGVFLLLGVIVNVAVAWGCAAYIDSVSRFSGVIEESTNDRFLLHFVSDGMATGVVHSYVNYDSRRYEVPSIPTTTLPHWYVDRQIVWNVPISKGFHFWQVAWGWPFLSLSSWFDVHTERIELPPGTKPHSFRMDHVVDPRWGIPMSFVSADSDPSNPMNVGPGRPRIAPLRPIWPGLAINTIFYATILWLLWIARARVRRFIRIRRHRCPACGYEIAAGVGPRCSECGAELPRAMRG